MTVNGDDRQTVLRGSVLLIGPKVPPYGGMAIQGQLMQQLMLGEGLSVHFLPSNLPFPNGFGFLDRLRGVRPFLRSLNFSIQLWRILPYVGVVHILACSWLYFFLIVCPAVSLSRLRRKRVILNYRGGQADQFLRYYAIVLRPFFRMVHVVTAPSQFLVNVLGRRVGVPVAIVPNIVNVSRFPHRERRHIEPKMIVTRHLLKLYDIESVIRAFGLVQEKYPNASLKVVGTGDQEKHLRHLVADLGLKSVEFMGYIPQENLPAVYDQCDILLNASLADNFPGSLVEAAAAGLLVVSTSVGGIPFIFEDCKSAILVEPGDWRGLASGVLRILREPAFASYLSAQALSRCKTYEWSNIRQKLYRLYGFDSEVAGQVSASALSSMSVGL